MEEEEMAYTGDWMLPNTKRLNFVFQTCVIFKDDDEHCLLNKDFNWVRWLTFPCGSAVWFTKNKNKYILKILGVSFSGLWQTWIMMDGPCFIGSLDIPVFWAEGSEGIAHWQCNRFTATLSEQKIVNVTFWFSKECTRNFCANNVNQMHKGNFIKYRTHSSLKWHFSYQGTDIHIGDHQILHKLGNFGQNNVVEIIIMNGVTEYVIHRLFSGQSTRFHNWNENIVDSSKYFQHFICLVQTSYESRTVIFQKFPQCDSWE